MKRNRNPMYYLFSGLLLASTTLSNASPVLAQELPDPENIWIEINPEDVDFPADFIPPAEFLVHQVDLALLSLLLEDAPLEQFSGTPIGSTFIPVPLPGFGEVEVAVVTTLLMERTLALDFPEIRTYRFWDEETGASGHLVLGPDTVYLASRVEGRLAHGVFQRLDSGQRVLVSFFDTDRRDGANDDVIVHPPIGDDDHDDPGDLTQSGETLSTTQALGVQNVIANGAVSGTQMRIYRLAAATTAEFYQARGGNDLSVLLSLVIDVAGANAELESEVAVRLVIAQASWRDLFYTNAGTDPFANPGAVCSVSGTACDADDQCPLGESCNTGFCSVGGGGCNSDADCDPNDATDVCNIRTTCELRNDNRDNMLALHGAGVVTHDEYDLGVLFAVSRPGVRGGCAWFSICLEGNVEHKARAMVSASNNGTDSTSGVLVHEIGHMLGAHHTFTGLAGACTAGEFTVDNSASGYEPGSGTTRMSYRGLCADDDGDDNVDVSNDPPSAPAYFHSRSFDEIIENVFSGDGATCGALVNTGNQPPLVAAGPDYAIPTKTPFTLRPLFWFDHQPLKYRWEQFDRAFFQRPIDTDFVTFLGAKDFGPIIRSVPPGPDVTRTVPNLADLLDGTSQPPLSINRKGEMLPQVDRELNFRFIASDGQLGGGGVAYDAMTITAEGDPFYLTYPNGGEQLRSGCTAVATWEVGGSDVAPVSAAQVDLLFSNDGGGSFSPLIDATPNDGGQAFSVPCPVSGTSPIHTARMKAQGTGNIFFDISDGNFQIFSAPPDIDGSTVGGSVDEQCTFEASLEATVTDDCGVAAGDVTVQVAETTGHATLGLPNVSIVQNGVDAVDVEVSVTVSDLTTSPAEVRFTVEAEDNCGLTQARNFFALVEDTTPPTIEVSLDPDLLWPPNHEMIAIEAEVIVEDNCGIASFVLDGVSSDEPDDDTGDGAFINDIQGVEAGTADLAFELRSERMQKGDGRVYTATYTASDPSSNTATEEAHVLVPPDMDEE